MGCGTTTKTPIKMTSTVLNTEMKSSDYFARLQEGFQWMLFENWIIDADSVIKAHPEGKSLISFCVGKEISRYVYGAFTPEVDCSKALVTKVFRDIKQHIVGSIRNLYIDKLFIPVDPPIGDRVDGAWHLTSRTKITDIHYVCKFTRNNFLTCSILPYFDIFGKYVSIFSHHLQLSRNYALAFVFSPSFFPHLMKMVEAFKKREDFETSFSSIHSVYKDGIELFIKSNPTVAKFIHEIPLDPTLPENQFTISGPFGHGLGVRLKQGGTILCFMMGTPLILWGDLAGYIIRKNIYHASKVIKKNYLLFKDEDFDKLDDDSFKMVIFASVTKRSHLIGLELFEACSEISKEFLFNNFEFYLRVSEEGHPRWSLSDYGKYIDGDLKKVYIAGPKEASLEVQEQLIMQNVKEFLIHRVQSSQSLS